MEQICCQCAGAPGSNPERCFACGLKVANARIKELEGALEACHVEVAAANALVAVSTRAAQEFEAAAFELKITLDSKHAKHQTLIKAIDQWDRSGLVGPLLARLRELVK